MHTMGAGSSPAAMGAEGIHTVHLGGFHDDGLFLRRLLRGFA